MNTEIIANAISTYPGFAVACGAAALWAARYVKKIKTENEQMKAETNRGERAAIMKIQDMQEILDDIEYGVRIQSNNVEEELIGRQVSNLKQKEILKDANDVMVDSIEKKEAFHDNLLTQFEDLEGMLQDFDRASEVGQMMTMMRSQFEILLSQQDELRQDTLELVNELQANLATVENIAREVGV